MEQISIYDTLLQQNNDCPYAVPTVDEILKDVENMCGRLSKHEILSDIFECMALSISNKTDLRSTVLAKRKQRLQDIYKIYNNQDLQHLNKICTKIFLLCSSVVYDNGVFADYLGELYMRSGTSNDKAGQFFTPYCVSKMSAELTLNENVINGKIKNDEIITLNDPTCGSAGMMLACLDILKNTYNVNYARDVFISCGDIDKRCVNMAYIQLSLAGVPAIIKQQNALSRELYDYYYTPAYLFQWLRFRKFDSYVMNG